MIAPWALNKSCLSSSAHIKFYTKVYPSSGHPVHPEVEAMVLFLAEQLREKKT